MFMYPSKSGQERSLKKNSRPIIIDGVEFTGVRQALENLPLKGDVKKRRAFLKNRLADLKDYDAYYKGFDKRNVFTL